MKNKNANQLFWSTFIKTNWEIKFAHLKQTQLPILQINADIIFQWLVKYSDHCRKTKSNVGLKFFIDGESQYQNEVLQALPEKSDKSLVGYNKRMSRLFPDYCLVCDELIQVSGPQWKTLGEFVNELYNYVGIPNRPAEIGLYLGNYKKTPFGVHVDGCGVLSIPVVGTKKFRIWKPSYVKKNPDLEMAFDYQHHLKSSSLITAKPGDLVYWPSSAWHIAESDGSFSATWSLGLWVDQPFSEILLQTTESVLLEKIDSIKNRKYIAQKKKNSFGQVEKLPDLLSKSVNQLKSITANELSDAFMKHWLRVQSKNGFKSALIPDLKLKLSSHDLIRGDDKNPLPWAQLKSGKLCVANHGELIEMHKSQKNLAFVKLLNSGKSFQISIALKNHPQRKEIFKILTALYQSHQITKTA